MFNIFMVFVGVVLLWLLATDPSRDDKGKERFFTLGVLRFVAYLSLSIELLKNVAALL